MATGTEETPVDAPGGGEPTVPGALTERLLHAAAEVFAEEGDERAGVAEIARRAGVTTGAIYSRYTGKAQLLLDAVDHHVSHDIEQLLRAEHPGESATDVLASLGSHLLDDLPTGSGLFLEAIVAGRRDPELAAAIRRRVEGEDARLAKLVDAAVGGGDGQCLGGVDDEVVGDGLIDPTLDRLATVRLAHAIGFGMTLTRAMGLELPATDAWTTVIDRVITAVAVPDAPPHSQNPETTQQTGVPQ